MAAHGWIRVSAGAVVAGAGLWLAAAALIVWQPGEVSAIGIHTTVVPAALVLLAVGLGGLHRWLAGPVPARRDRPRGGGLASGLLAMSSRRHQALSATDGHSEEPRLRAARVGVRVLRVGAVAILAGLVLGGEAGAARPLLNVGWFLFFAGALAVGIAAAVSDEVPRASGALVAVGSLLVFSSVAKAVGGASRRPEVLGPLLSSAGGVPVASLLLWIAFGAGCAWLGVAMWRAGA